MKFQILNWIFVLILILSFPLIKGFRLSDIFPDEEAHTFNVTGIGLEITIFGNFSFNNVSMDNTPPNLGTQIFLDTFLDYYIYNKTGETFDYQPSNSWRNITLKEANVYQFFDKVNLTEEANTGIYDSKGHLISPDVNLTLDSTNFTKKIASSYLDPLNITFYGFIDSCNDIDTPRFTSDTSTYIKNYTVSEYTCSDNILGLNITGLEQTSSSNILIIDSVIPLTTLISPADAETDSDGNVLFQYEADDTNLENCTLFLDNSGGSYSNTTLTANETVNELVTGLSDGITYNWHIDCFDTNNNNGTSNSRSLGIDFGAGVVTVTSGGGGAPKEALVCAEGDRNWFIVPRAFDLLLGKNAERKKTLEITNNGTVSVDFEVECVDTGSGNFTKNACQFINISESSFGLEPNIKKPKLLDVLIVSPENITYGESFSFGIFFTDNKGCEKTVSALITSSLVFGSYAKVLDTKDIIGVSIPNWIPFILIFIMFLSLGILGKDKSIALPFIGVFLGLMLSFSYLALI